MYACMHTYHTRRTPFLCCIFCFAHDFSDRTNNSIHNEVHAVFINDDPYASKLRIYEWERERETESERENEWKSYETSLRSRRMRDGFRWQKYINILYSRFNFKNKNNKNVYSVIRTLCRRYVYNRTRKKENGKGEEKKEKNVRKREETKAWTKTNVSLRSSRGA